MPLVPCESCSRHVRVTEDACPFCKAVRIGAKVAGGLALVALAACGDSSSQTYSPASKYGGPPAPAPLDVPVIDAGPSPVDGATASAAPPSADLPDASPRLTDSTDAGARRFAPVALYGAPPRRQKPPTPQ